MRPYYLTLALLLLTTPILQAEETNAVDYLEQLQNQAREMVLASSREWQSLMHYVPYRPISDVKSTIDDDIFFLSENGKYDASAELEQTIKAFFHPKKEGTLHPQCQFVARYHWLKSKLTFDPAKLLEIDCLEFKEWQTGIDAASVTLVFPTSFINNPASAFGHTLLRLDQSKTAEEAPLLSYAVNYSAATSGEDALTYAFLGVTGGYQGFYNIAPYYKLVTRYSDIESRDIWEYKLDFTQDEVDRLVRHLWELRSVSSDYYYFDENCSYHLLALLDAARPELNLLSSASMWVIPIDTVKALGNLQDLSPVFRPSKATVLKAKTAEATNDARSLAQLLIDQINTPLPELLSGSSTATRAAALDLAYDYLSYKERYRSDETKILDKRMFEILSERSKVDTISPSVEVPSPISPENGHGTMRLSVGAGKVSNNWRGELELRPAYHSLLDPKRGYTPGSQIEFFGLGASYREEGDIEFQKFTFIDVISLNTNTPFSSPLSWALDVSADRMRSKSDSDSLLPHLDLGFGKAFELGNDHSFFYLLADLNVELHGSYDHNSSIGNGATAGLIYHLSNDAAFQLEARGGRMFIGEENTHYSLTASPRLSLSSESALRFEVGRTFRFHEHSDQGMLYIDLYL